MKYEGQGCVRSIIWKRSNILLTCCLILSGGLVAFSSSVPAAPAAAPTPQVVGHSVTLTLQGSPDADGSGGQGYTFYRATACTGAGFAKLNTALVAGLVFTDAGLKPGAYCYRATFSYGGAESVPSNTAPVVLLPAAPSALVAAGL